VLLTQHIREQSQYIVKILNTLSLTHTLSHSISLPLYHTHSLSGSVELTHTRAITAHRGDTQHTYTLSRTHTLSLSLSLSTTLLHTQGLFNQHILEQSQHIVEILNTHTHTFSLSLPLPLPLSLSLSGFIQSAHTRTITAHCGVIQHTHTHTHTQYSLTLSPSPPLSLSHRGYSISTYSSNHSTW